MIVSPVADLDKHWPRVRQGLERILAKSPQSWIPEHVYRALAQGEAGLFIRDNGFMVFSIMPGDDRRGLMHIWAIAGDGYEETRADVYAEIEAFCRSKGIRRIRQFGRKGWAKDPFWQMTGYVYEHEVT